MPKVQARKVLLVTDGDLYLEKGLNVDPDVQLYEVAPKDFSSRAYGQGGAGYDLVVFDDFHCPAICPPWPLPRLPCDRSPDAGTVPAGADASSPAVLDWSRTDSLMRFVDLSALKLRAAASCTAAGWGRVRCGGR